MAKINKTAFFILLSIPGFYCNPCGDPPVCKCYEAAGLISCKEITEFPSFNDTETRNIDMLDIVNSSLSTLPNLDGWQNLALLTSIGNKFLDCKDLHNHRGGFYINSDCPKDHLSNVEKIIYQLIWPYFLSIIPFSLLGLVGGYMLMYLNLRRNVEKPDKIEI